MRDNLCVADRAHCRRNPRGGSRGGNHLKGWMLVVANVRGALVPNVSGSMGSTAGRKASQRRKGRAAPERGSSIVLDLLLTEGGNNARGVVHEQDRSIKEDKKCGEPAGGP